MSGDEEGDDDASNVDSVVIDAAKEATAATWTSFSTLKQANSGNTFFSIFNTFNIFNIFNTFNIFSKKYGSSQMIDACKNSGDMKFDHLKSRNIKNQDFFRSDC